jgi:hypothetical protein
MADLGRKRQFAGYLLGGAVLATLAFVAAGCGGSSSASSSTPPAATTTNSAAGTGANAGAGNRTAAFQAFTTCLKQHGVSTAAGFGFGFGRGRRPGAGGSGTGTGTNPTPPATGQTRPRRPTLTATQQKALQTCRSKLPNGGNFNGGGGGFRGRNGGGGANTPALARYTQCLKTHGVTFGTATKPATFQKAQKACAKFRPTGAGAPPGGSGGTTTTAPA